MDYCLRQKAVDQQASILTLVLVLWQKLFRFQILFGWKTTTHTFLIRLNYWPTIALNLTSEEIARKDKMIF